MAFRGVIGALSEIICILKHNFYNMKYVSLLLLDYDSLEGLNNKKYLRLLLINNQIFTQSDIDFIIIYQYFRFIIIKKVIFLKKEVAGLSG